LLFNVYKRSIVGFKVATFFDDALKIALICTLRKCVLMHCCLIVFLLVRLSEWS